LCPGSVFTFQFDTEVTTTSTCDVFGIS